MLVLSRKLGESVEIGDNKVIVRVLGIKRSKVQLGVDAPPEVAIHRSEKADRYTPQDSHRTRIDDVASSETAIDDAGQHHASPQGIADSLMESTRANSSSAIEFAMGFGESILEDLVRVQAEIAVLAELAPSQKQCTAQHVAAEAIERLAAMERSLRAVRRQTAERPIAAFVGSRSKALQQMDCQDDSNTSGEHDSDPWSDPCSDSSSLIREENAPFQVGAAHCSVCLGPNG